MKEIGCSQTLLRIREGARSTKHNNRLGLKY